MTDPQNPYQQDPRFQQGPPAQPYSGPQQPPYGQQPPPAGHQMPAFANKLASYGDSLGAKGPMPSGAVPKSVNLAFVAFLVGGGLGALYNLVLIIFGGFYFSSGSIFPLLINAGVIVLAYLARGGQEWARITVTVIAGVVLLFTLWALSSIGFIFTFLGAIGILTLVCVIGGAAAMGAGIFFLFRPDSNAYYKGVR